MDGYDVDGAELHDGSSSVRHAVDGAEDVGEPDAQYGHALLHQAVAGFCDAVNTAVAAMLAQAAETSHGLDTTARAYADDDATARDQVVGAGG
jgi:hypothetical protein